MGWLNGMAQRDGSTCLAGPIGRWTEAFISSLPRTKPTPSGYQPLFRRRSFSACFDTTASPSCSAKALTGRTSRSRPANRPGVRRKLFRLWIVVMDPPAWNIVEGHGPTVVNSFFCQCTKRDRKKRIHAIYRGIFLGRSMLKKLAVCGKAHEIHVVLWDKQPLFTDLSPEDGDGTFLSNTTVVGYRSGAALLLNSWLSYYDRACHPLRESPTNLHYQKICLVLRCFPTQIKAATRTERRLQ